MNAELERLQVEHCTKVKNIECCRVMSGNNIELHNAIQISSTGNKRTAQSQPTEMETVQRA